MSKPSTNDHFLMNNNPWIKYTGVLPKSNSFDDEVLTAINEKIVDIKNKLSRHNYVYVIVSKKYDALILDDDVSKVNVVVNSDIILNKEIISKIKLELSEFNCYFDYGKHGSIYGLIKIVSTTVDNSFKMLNLKEIKDEINRKNGIKKCEVKKFVDKFIPLIEKTILNVITQSIENKIATCVLKKPSIFDLTLFFENDDVLKYYSGSFVQETINEILSDHFVKYETNGYKVVFVDDLVKINIDQDEIYEIENNCEKTTELNLLCDICKLYKKNIAINCGHIFCPKCCDTEICYVCNAQIFKKIKIYM
jgi:hypothetical protein